MWKHETKEKYWMHWQTRPCKQIEIKKNEGIYCHIGSTIKIHQIGYLGIYNYKTRTFFNYEHTLNNKINLILYA